jgi:hypothetical protein
VSDEIYIEQAPPSEIYQESVGPPIIVYAGAAGLASGVVVSPPIPGLNAQNTQDAIAELTAQATLTQKTITPIGGHRIVYLDADGAKYASNNDLSHLGRVVGITLGASDSNNKVFIRTSGEVVEPSWNWSKFGPVFLGQNGLLTQSSPGPPAFFSQVVGQAIGPTQIVINIQPPIVLI